MRFIELFAGIGGFRRGLEPLGWECVWANENDPYACNVYRKNFGDKELFEGDIDWILESPNLIYSQPDFPVSHFRLPAVNQEKMTIETSGAPQLTPFAYYDQDIRSWRMFQESLVLGDQHISGEYLEAFPKAGIMRNGIVYQHPVLDLPTKEPECFLLPTVTATDNLYSSPQKSQTLREVLTKHFLGVEDLRGLGITSPKFLNPLFAERMMGIPQHWTDVRKSDA